MSQIAGYDFEPDAYQFDFEPGEDWPDYDPERTATRGRSPYRPTVGRPAPRPQTYTPSPSSTGGPVTRADLTRALQKVAVDIDRLKAGARATTGQINDLSDRTGRAFTNVRTSQQQQAVRFDRGLSSTRELAVLGSLLGGSGSGAGGSSLLLLLLLGNDSGMAIDGSSTNGGGALGGSNSTLLLALALSGALTK